MCAFKCKKDTALGPTEVYLELEESVKVRMLNFHLKLQKSM